MIYDVIVVGGGVAGLMASIEVKIKNPNFKVAVVTKGNIFKSNSSLASGGINGVLSNDSVEIKKHIDDTLSGAFGLADKKAVSYMCQQAQKSIEKLVEYGVLFDRDEAGNILQRSFGGGSSKRTCFVGDKTGGAITSTLIKKAKEVGVEFVVNTFVLNLAKINNSISGIVALRRIDSSVVVFPAKSVILAGGGYAGIYRGFSTNASDYTGDILAVALRAGLHLVDMEFVQFHPTGFIKTSYLVSEAARGEGGYLINSDGNRFVNELETRDVVSRAIASEIAKGQKVYIDLRHLPKEQIETKLPSLQKAALMQAGIDVCTELLEIKPVAHYTMGGIETDMTSTAIKGLFACGECSANGVHGANRLGGNSLLEGVVFGELAGQKASKYTQGRDFLPIDYNIVVKDLKKVDYIFLYDSTKNFNAMRVSLGKTMFDLVGITRDEKGLEKAYDYLKYLRNESRNLHCMDKSKSNNVELVSILELQNALLVAECTVLLATKRKESRGSHFRSDYPTSSQNLSGHIFIKEVQYNYFKIWFENNNLIQKIIRFFVR